MKVREQITDAKTGEVSERWIDLPDVMTEAEAKAKEDAERIAAHNAALIAEMDLADLRIIRARLEGDSERVAAHVKAQAERRSRLL